MSHESIRLETPGGTVIAYFAPSFEVVPADQNEVFENPLPTTGGALARDNGLWTSELTVQGAFVHSEDVPSEFRDALQTLFGQQTVTPTDQINRLRAYTVYADPGSFHFYHNENAYVADDAGGIDIENGVYPAVAVTELRTPEEGETSSNRADFLVRMSVGFGGA